MKGSQVAHIWFNRSKQHATASNIFFEGGNIYSYGRHFLMASIVENKKGERAVFVTTRGYSSSTSRHQSYVERAMDNRYPIFRVKLDMQGMDSRWIETYSKTFLNEYKQRLIDAENAIKKCQAKKADGLLTWLKRLTEEANNYAAYVGNRTRFKVKQSIIDIAEKKKAALAEAEAKRNTPAMIAKREKAREKRAEAKERKREIAIKEWIEGESNSVKWERGDITYMRVRGDQIETTQGAAFPIEHGKRALRFIIDCRANKKEWHTNGHKIPLGHFHIDSIDASGNVKAGCHNVPYGEIERIAKELNLI